MFLRSNSNPAKVLDLLRAAPRTAHEIAGALKSKKLKVAYNTICRLRRVRRIDLVEGRYILHDSLEKLRKPDDPPPVPKAASAPVAQALEELMARIPDPDLTGLPLADLEKYHTLMRESFYLAVCAQAIIAAAKRYPLRQENRA